MKPWCEKEQQEQHQTLTKIEQKIEKTLKCWTGKEQKGLEKKRQVPLMEQQEALMGREELEILKQLVVPLMEQEHLEKEPKDLEKQPKDLEKQKKPEQVLAQGLKARVHWMEHLTQQQRNLVDWLHCL